MMTSVSRPLRIIATLLFALVASAALAAGHLGVIDSGVDYTDDDLGSAYIAMQFDGDTLWLTIDDASFEGAMPSIDFDVPDLGREDFLGNDIGAQLSDIDDMTWTAVGRDVPTANALHGVSYRHNELSLREGADLYVEAFEAMGFQTEMARTAASSVMVGTFTHGDTVVTVRLHSLGSELEVDLTVL